tara:strand:- start:642 stop:998 length:357 start_codon:yes stop_codon:yes gene_type:complete
MNNHFKLYLVLFLSIFTYPLLSDELIKQRVISDVEIEYEYNCDSIVLMVIEDTRERKLDWLGNNSIEQIYEREIQSIQDDKVDCNGVALISNGSKLKINYGMYVDELNARILYYQSKL